MHYKRVLVAILLLPLFYVYVMHLPSEYFLFLLIFFSTIAITEFYSMFRIKGIIKYSGIISGALLLAVFYANREIVITVLFFSALSIMAVRLFKQRDPCNSGAEIATVLLGLLYIPGLLGFQLELVKAGPEWVILLYASVWASDSMAYYAGTAFGRRKLYKEISPNKTVAGAVGSAAGGVLGAILTRAAIMPALQIRHALLIGIIVGVTTVIGDLIESMFKRDAGVKDSSSIIPGHGGVLDKLDGVTFAGPALYLLCTGLGLF